MSSKALDVLVLSAIALGLVAWAGAREPNEPATPSTRQSGTSGVGQDSTPPDRVTFTEHVAPILFENCAPCHRPGGPGPFSLLVYREARKRAQQIAEVTRTRFMPPWLPAPGYGEFVGERRLTEEQIEILQRWASTGAVQGDPADLPPRPQWTEGWELGEPDLVVKLPRPYTLPSEGVDVYRNFVIPVPLSATRYVKTVDFRLLNPQVVHHARMLIDRTGVSRLLEQADPEPGFDGMDLYSAENPDGVMVSWAPGKTTLEGTEGIAWKLGKGTDIVLQLHMLPSGRPERIEPSLGLYFADGPPTLRPFSFVLGTREIDIPAGKKDYMVEDSFKLPVDVEALGIYPHTHYLGKDLKAFATLPDGTRRWLLWIKDWDFNWQDEYQYVSPVSLPKGSTVTMRYTYDNSADNVRNPNYPPRRVRYGARTSDEMAELLLQVLPRKDEELAILKRDFELHNASNAIAFRKKLLEANPNDAESHAALGSSYMLLGRLDEAIRHLEASLRLRPRNARVLNNLGYALQLQGRIEEAIRFYREAVHVEPELLEAHHNLGRSLRRTGRLDEALVHLRKVSELLPDSPRALSELAWVLATHPDPAARRPDEAIQLATRAAELSGEPEPVMLATLAAAYAAANRFDRAVTSAQTALELALAAEATRQADEIRWQLELYRSGESYRPRHPSSPPE